jgi:4-hydroxy-2-oxoglutarate aldolase
MVPLSGPLARGLPRLLRRLASTGPAAPDLAGVYPPIVTPFLPDERIAWDELRANLGRWREQPLRGFLVHGSNGEFCYLTAEERVEVIRVVKEEAAPGQLVLAGSGCESTRETIAMTAAMAEAGADVAVVITPCYYKAKMTGAALEQHFTAVADASPVPVVLYSVPANTAIDLAVGSVARLAAHPNIIGMKESGGDVAKIGEMVHLTKQHGFQLLAGSASFLMPALSVSDPSSSDLP